MKSNRRTAVAAIALAVAVLVPTTAWYLTGSSDASRRARALEDRAFSGVQSELHRDSDRLAIRLEVLRSGETERPFFHYQNITHDPRGAAEGLAVAPSPLSRGVSDPLVWAHFQLDESGLVTVPMVNERFPELTSDESFNRFCSLLAELQNAMALGLKDPSGIGSGYFDGDLITIRRSEWEQIRDADQVYAAITGRGEAPQRRRTDGTDSVTIRVGPLEWHTMDFDAGPILAALREVETPLGTRLQGFAIAPSGVEQWFGNDTDVAMTFTPSDLVPIHRLSSPVSNTGWWLSSDPGPVIGEAREEGRRAVTDFRRVFAIGLVAVLLSALAVMSVMLQTERLARQRARFAASAAHELKTPLASLRLHSEMLSEGLGRPGQSAVYAGRIAAESGRLGRVVSNMLDLARLERGTQIANPQPGDAGGAVAHCLDRLRPSLHDAGLDTELMIENDLPKVMLDQDALCQILDNLLDNAEKYTRNQDRRTASIAVRRSPDGVRITVADTGPGIHGLSRSALFEPYRRPDNDNAPAGLGLGLALARSLARAQGGELELADEQGTGATFVLSLAASQS
jgi:signal transduction histidine kinase